MGEAIWDRYCGTDEVEVEACETGTDCVDVSVGGRVLVSWRLNLGNIMLVVCDDRTFNDGIVLLRRALHMVIERPCMRIRPRIVFAIGTVIVGNKLSCKYNKYC